MGEVKLTQKQGDKYVDFTIGIYECNALTAFVHRVQNEDGSWRCTLYSFLADKDHVNNILRSGSDFFGKDTINEIKLNMAYKGSDALLKLFTRQHYEVKCIYCKLQP